MDFPIAELMDPDACYAKLLTWLHPDGLAVAMFAALPDTLQLMAGSLSAGLSLAQSIDTIVNEGVEPIASEFRRVLVETRLGVSLETALGGVGERFESKDFEWVVMAINIQRRVGARMLARTSRTSI